MKILIISALYYPARSPNVYRWDAIARLWAAQGNEIHWLCTRFGDEPAETKVNHVYIHRTGYHTLLDWVYDKLGTAGRRGTLGAGKPRSNGFRKFIEQIVNLTWRKVYWPDGSCLWYFPAKRKALQLMLSHSFDVIISVSLPFTSVLIASAIKKKYPHVRWLMDIEDPFSFVEEYFINNRAFFKQRNITKEGRALRLANRVAVTVEAARQKYLACYPLLENKIAVAPPLFEEIETDFNKEPGVELEPAKIHLAYFGTFYFPIRSPEGLLGLIGQVISLCPEMRKKLVFHFAGTIPLEYAGRFQDFPAPEMLRFYGLVSREQVAAMMVRMDFLLNIGNSTDYHLPSKSAEYLMSGKPIVNLASCTADTFATFMKNYPLILNLVLKSNKATPEQCKRFIQFLEKERGNAVNASSLQVLGREYSVKAVAGKYMQLLLAG
ncbi:MAG: hypothetical protein R2830_27335 [Saprospiraceae bacterium]